MFTRWIGLALLASVFGFASESSSYLVKLQDSSLMNAFVRDHGGQLELVSPESGYYKWTTSGRHTLRSLNDTRVVAIEKNATLRIPANPSLEENREKIQAFLKRNSIEDGPAFPDNPDIKNPEEQAKGADPLLKNAWGIAKIHADTAWDHTAQGKDIIVAVTDTGVDYNHPDLLNNMWRNPKEIPGDGIDNDGNGYVDDVVGWDFAKNDNKPYDLSLSMIDILFSGGNPGHGTHVSGVIGARLNNNMGTAGVAPQVKIMALRFLTEKGSGELAGAVGCIDYAIKNGAKIINASWGSEGEEDDSAALKEALQRADKAGVLFLAAAGNGRLNQQTYQQAGYDNDSDAKPNYPSSYPYENILAIAALDSSDKLGTFSNYGKKTVHLAAPGVSILSTVPGGKYQEVLIDLGGKKVTWDGTSMATPFVAGAAAVLWSEHKNWSMKEVRDYLLGHTVAVDALQGKTVTGGRIDVR